MITYHPPKSVSHGHGPRARSARKAWDSVQSFLRQQTVPVPGQPFADEAQSALSAMVLGRQVTAQIRERDQDGIAAVEVVEPHGHVVNLELVRRGLAWRDYFDAQNQPDREQYQTALSEAQQARQGLWSQDRVEAPRDYRARVS